MAYSESLASRIRTVLKRGRGMGEQKMFGGVCFSVNGHMVCGVVKDDLMVRVGPEAYQESLKRMNTRPMDFTGRPMVGYVYVSAAGIRSEPSLKNWLGVGVAYVRSLPPKSAETIRPKGKSVKKAVKRKPQRPRAA